MDLASAISLHAQTHHTERAPHAGEHGELLFGQPVRQLLPEESPTQLPEAPKDLLRLLDKLLGRPGLPSQAVEYGLTALVKLSARFPDHSALIQVSGCRPARWPLPPA